MTNTPRTIEILVSPAGEMRLQTKGFAGSECREASRLLEQALGERSAEQLTAEFYQAHHTTEQQTHQG